MRLDDDRKPTGMIRKTVLYSGNVQGVGFRFTAARTASGYEVSGYVRNLPDGRVEIVAEGDRHEVDAFLGDVEKRMSGYISDVHVSQTPTEGHFGGFEVRY